MPRNNQDRLTPSIGSDKVDDNSAVIMADSFSFVTPTEFVTLPSGGKLYPKSHPLHNVEDVEIKYMTAKEEDLLTSTALLNKGTAINKLLESVLVNKNIKADDLLVGDKNAILIATRITGYGNLYETTVRCPICLDRTDFCFNLNETLSREPKTTSKQTDITESGTFFLELPMTGVTVEIKLLTGAEETKLTKLEAYKKKNKLQQSRLTDQLRVLIVSVNGSTEKKHLNDFVNNLPTKDSKYIREEYTKMSPDVDFNLNFECDSCGVESAMEVPLTAEFFWPK